MKAYKIAALPGDGIGPEVIDAGMQVLDAVAAREKTLRFDFERFCLELGLLSRARSLHSCGWARTPAHLRRHLLWCGGQPSGARPHLAMGSAARDRASF